MNTRLDLPHLRNSPHTGPVPEDVLLEWVSQLEQDAMDFPKLVEQLEQYPVILKRIVQAANSVTTGRWQVTSNPVQAASYLGTRRIIQILLNFGPDSVAISRALSSVYPSISLQ